MGHKEKVRIVDKEAEKSGPSCFAGNGKWETARCLLRPLDAEAPRGPVAVLRGIARRPSGDARRPGAPISPAGFPTAPRGVVRVLVSVRTVTPGLGRPVGSPESCGEGALAPACTRWAWRTPAPSNKPVPGGHGSQTARVHLPEVPRGPTHRDRSKMGAANEVGPGGEGRLRV